MPVFSYFVVVGSALLGLIFAADYAWGPKTMPQAAIAAAHPPASPVKVVSGISTRDLPRETPPIKPAVPTTELSSATTGQAGASSPTVAAAPNPPKPTAAKTAERKKVKTKIAAPRPKGEQYARGDRYEYQQPYYQQQPYYRQPYYGGLY